MFGKLFDKVQITKEYITESLKETSEDLQIPFKDLFYMIKPVDDKFNFKIYIYKMNEKGTPQHVREITVNEIVGE